MDYQTVTPDELKLSIPSGIVVSGPSSSGKTELVLRLLKHANELFNPPPKAISKLIQLSFDHSLQYGAMVSIQISSPNLNEKE